MSRIVDALRHHAAATPDRVALDDGRVQMTYAVLLRDAEALAARLALLSPRVLGLFADNGASWVLTDLAAMIAGIPIVPLPLFASPAQIAHVVRSTGMDFVVTDAQDRFCAALSPGTRVTMSSFARDTLIIGVASAKPGEALPERCWKVTFTSGTTGEPKGVCLSLDTLERTALALLTASAGSSRDRHLCVLPLATLLENIGGIYAPLLAGARIHVPPLAQVGLAGSSSLDAARLAEALRATRATSAILVPEMLAALVGALGSGAERPDDLRFVAVGGATVSTRILGAARALGVPVFEGYGLSECGSVVSVNRPDASRVGSVGRPLPHVRIEIARDGEILVRGSACLGYLGGCAPVDPLATGDIGYIDADGYLHVTGRRRNVLITSFGRNISPEWIERELVAQPAIAQAAVFGEARPFVAGVIVARGGASAPAIAAAVEAVNRQLPDYARVAAWIAATEPFASANAMATSNGRLRRDAIGRAYAGALDALYET